MSSPTLFLAAGHGGADKGNTSTEFVERDELITIVNQMARWYDLCLELPRAPGGVVIIDHALELAGTIKAIEAWRPDAGDLAIDIHLDFKKGSSGALILVDEQPTAKAFAEAFLPDWSRATGIRNGGVWDSKRAAQQWRGWPDYGFCARKWPGIILEIGCLNSGSDMQCVKDQFNQTMLAHLVWKTWTEVRGS